jgi:hypothetical protein
VKQQQALDERAWQGVYVVQTALQVAAAIVPVLKELEDVLALLCWLQLTSLSRQKWRRLHVPMSTLQYMVDPHLLKHPRMPGCYKASC